MTREILVLAAGLALCVCGPLLAQSKSANSNLERLEFARFHQDIENKVQVLCKIADTGSPIKGYDFERRSAPTLKDIEGICVQLEGSFHDLVDNQPIFSVPDGYPAQLARYLERSEFVAGLFAGVGKRARAALSEGMVSEALNYLREARDILKNINKETVGALEKVKLAKNKPGINTDHSDQIAASAIKSSEK